MIWSSGVLFTRSGISSTPGSAWQTPANVSGAVDGNYTTARVGSNITSANLISRNFGFTVPSTAMIGGVTASWYRRKATANGSIYDNNVQLVLQNVASGTNLSGTAIWTAGSGWVSFGGSNDYWGLSGLLTSTTVNASGFGCAIAVKNINGPAGSAQITAAQMVVFYQDTLPTLGSTVVSGTSYHTTTGIGSISDVGIGSIGSRGFVYFSGTSTDPTLATGSVLAETGSFAAGLYNLALSGLPGNWSFRVRDFAVNNSGAAYGTTVQLLTSDGGSPVTTLSSPSSGATNIITTTPTFVFAGSNVTGDRLHYNIQVALNGSFTTFSGVSTDNYILSSSSGIALSTGGNVEAGQAFTVKSGGYLSIARFYLSKAITPTGSAWAQLYFISGTYGTDACPSGTALTQSLPFDVSTLSNFAAREDINFNSSYYLNAGSQFIMTISYSGGGGGAAVNVFREDTSDGHNGNLSYRAASTWTTLVYDLDFTVKVNVPEVVLINRSTRSGESTFQDSTGSMAYPYNNGDTINYIPSGTDALPVNGSVYYWRARAIDTSEVDKYGAWSDIWNFTSGGGAPPSDNLYVNNHGFMTWCYQV